MTDSEASKLIQVLPPTFIYIPPVSLLVGVIYGATALERVYEGNPQVTASWASYKSLKKWFLGKVFRAPTRPSSLRSLDEMEKDMLAGGFIVPDVVWQPHCEWTSLLKQGLLADHRAIATWTGRLERDLELAASFVHLPDASDRIQASIQSPLIRELGAPRSWERMTSQEWVGDEAALLNCSLLKHNRVADAYSCVVRFLAWVVVDASLQHWQKVVTAGQQNEVLLQGLVPRLDPEICEWTRPLGIQVRELAIHAGYDYQRAPSVFLGQLWSSVTEQAEEKERTLRKWEVERPVRPRDSSINSLLISIDPQLQKHGGLWAESGAHRRRFQFAWAMIAILRDMQRLGLPDVLIDEVFSCYALEYRLARDNLCKPMA
ncbi:hypothetical protein [Pseudomonas cannabina]|uniref:Uncharacterized protein n=1 Tax=Pseudomonas cannabina pv. alisalensis TaxID=757414 RepID=A0ABS1XJ44_PSEC1|nr:hypothetical protein [Pseudomonas cannabina]MBM0141443.1 hypothetical protein [Pseudomonas cannabina pv. alisalensis]